MSTISTIGGASSSWPGHSRTHAAAKAGVNDPMMFTKGDGSASGPVDTPAQARPAVGAAAAPAAPEATARNLAKPPASTVEFAQMHQGAPHAHGAGGTKAAEAVPTGATAAGSTDASSATASADTPTDPLDTDGDGAVSAQERAAGELKDLMNQLVTSIDTSSDSGISQDDVEQFKSDFGSFVDQVVKQYSQGGATGMAATDTAGLVAMA